MRRLAYWEYSSKASINCLSQGLPLRKVSVSKNVTSEIRQKATKEYPFFLKSVMCSFWGMAFASTYIQSCDEEAIQVQQQLCAGTSPKLFAF